MLAKSHDSSGEPAHYNLIDCLIVQCGLPVRYDGFIFLETKGVFGSSMKQIELVDWSRNTAQQLEIALVLYVRSMNSLRS